MKRFSVSAFDGGVNDIDDATLISEGVLTRAINYEYRDLEGIKKRYGTDKSDLQGSGYLVF